MSAPHEAGADARVDEFIPVLIISPITGKEVCRITSDGCFVLADGSIPSEAASLFAKALVALLPDLTPAATGEEAEAIEWAEAKLEDAEFRIHHGDGGPEGPWAEERARADFQAISTLLRMARQGATHE